MVRLQSWSFEEFGFSNVRTLGNEEKPFIGIALRSTLAGVVAPNRVLSMGQIELFDI